MLILTGLFIYNFNVQKHKRFDPCIESSSVPFQSLILKKSPILHIHKFYGHMRITNITYKQRSAFGATFPVRFFCRLHYSQQGSCSALQFFMLRFYLRCFFISQPRTKLYIFSIPHPISHSNTLTLFNIKISLLN